ncbi:MAG TPA: NHL repeat-containing protein [Mucilaginibacter sp.]|nr:NHL repeat-containing protein [Mucilaginibacter sp.]
MRKFILTAIVAGMFAAFLAGVYGCGKELISPTHFSDTTVVAGSDSAGYLDGAGTVARFNHPFGLTLDKYGNIYVADQGNELIREISPSLVVTTFAGTPGVAGFTNGADTSASFNKPFGVAADSLGNIYVADAHNNAIRMISPAGVVSTFAGTGVAGAADGTDTASFNTPLGVAVDKTGNVYVADYENHIIRKISPAGAVSTLAGKAGVPGAVDGLDTAARFNLPEAVAVDAAGNVYVADNGNNAIRKVTPAGQVTTLAGNGSAGAANGSGNNTSFNSPFGIAVDAAGNVYVADGGNNMIRKITPSGTVSTLAGRTSIGAGNGVGTAATFNTPSGVAVDAAGNVYIADENNNLIRKISPSGTVTTLAIHHQSVLLGLKNQPKLQKITHRIK